MQIEIIWSRVLAYPYLHNSCMHKFRCFVKNSFHLHWLVQDGQLVKHAILFVLPQNVTFQSYLDELDAYEIEPLHLAKVLR